MQDITRAMCVFLSTCDSNDEDADLYNVFLQKYAQNLLPDKTAWVSDQSTDSWCLYQRFINLRKLQLNVLTVLGGGA
jgi:hypothetical protein